MRVSEQSQHNAFWMGGWPEYVAAALAFAGLIASVFNGIDLHGHQNAASDFKTLYASAWCFSHGIDAYQFPNLAAVFHANHIVEPVSWYGHAPVYPPFTLALLAPLTAVPMVPAICIWIAMSGILMGLATAALARSGHRVFGLPVLLRLLIVGVVAASPLLSLGMELGNVSVAVVGLCILALTSGPESNGWLPATGLAVAVILKPHIAFWAVLALLLSRAPADRRILVKTVGITVAALALITLWMVHDYSLMPLMAGYRAIVTSELSSGSMSPGNRDLMEIVVQITSVSHLIGYLLPPGLLPRSINIAVLTVMGLSLLRYALRFSRVSLQPRYVIAPAVFAFGLIATYHREADSILLLFILPYLFFRLHNNLKDIWAWSVLCLMLAGSVGPTLPMLRDLADGGVYATLRFLALRQAAIVNLTLAILLTSVLAARSGTGSQQNHIEA